jgi:hypothetical protein
MKALLEQAPVAVELAEDGVFRKGGHPTNTDMGGQPRTTEIFWDCANTDRSLEDMGLPDVQYRALLDRAFRKFATRVSKAGACSVLPARSVAHPSDSANRSVFVQGTIWGFVADPINFHPEDFVFVNARRGRNDALRAAGISMQPVRVDHHGFHARRELRELSGDERERKWRKQDAGVDVALTARLVRRCLADDHPAAVLLVSGDCDFVPVLQEVMETCPQITVGVAAFRSRLASVYWPDNKLGIRWHVKPIVLDYFLNRALLQRSEP